MKRSFSVSQRYEQDQDYDTDEECLFCLCPRCNQVFEIKNDDNLFSEEGDARDAAEISYLRCDVGHGKSAEDQQDIFGVETAAHEDSTDQEMQD